MKRIWYIPGGISLVGLLPLCLMDMRKKHVFHEYRALQITYPSISWSEDTITSVFAWDPNERKWKELKGKDRLTPPAWAEPKREWRDLKCDGPLSTTYGTIAEFRKLGQAISSTQDTLNGVRLNYGPRTKWNTVIAAVDAALADSTFTFWLNDSSIRTCWVPPAPPIPGDTFPAFACDVIPFCGTSKIPLSRSERITASFGPIFDGIVKYWPITILFLALSALSAARLRQHPR